MQEAADVGSPDACPTAPPYSDNWPFDGLTCTTWTVIYPDDLPPDVVANRAEILVQFLPPSASGSTNTTLTFTTPGQFTGTQIFELSEAPEWDPLWTSYVLQSANVAGTNAVWNGPLTCEGQQPIPVSPAAVAEVVETQSVCAGGVAQSATIVLPVDSTLVEYTADPRVPRRMLRTVSMRCRRFRRR